MAKSFTSMYYAGVLGRGDLSKKQHFYNPLSQDLQDGSVDQNPQDNVLMDHQNSRWIKFTLKGLTLVLISITCFFLGRLLQPVDENACIDTPWGEIPMNWA